MSRTKIILSRQSDLILTNATIVGATGILKSDIPDLVNDLANLNTSIQTEATDRSNEIGIERERINSILEGADINLNQFKEVVSFVQSIDMTNDADLLTAITQINGKISTEEFDRIAADDQLSAELATLQSYVDTTVNSAISQLTSDLSDETSARIADVDAEETRAIAAEGLLQTNINAEANERVAEDMTLQGNIDIEATRAQSAETTIATDLGTETTARIDAVSTEETRATNAENILRASLSTEIARAYDAEGVLQTNINTEKSRIDAILIGASASADNFAEIVSLINSVDTTNDQVFAGYVLSNDAALAAEVSRAESADSALTSDLSAEVSRATASEGVLRSDLSTEVSRATAAESTLTSALSAEESSRIAADSALQASLNNEISDRVAAGQSTQAALDNESARAIAAESALQSAIDAESAARIAADETLDGKIAGIISNTNAPIIDSFTEVVDNLNAEITRAETAESALQSAIAAESAARIAADETLDGKIADIISNTNAPIIDSFTEVVDNLNAEIARAEAAESDLDATKLDLAGGIMSGSINMDNHSVDGISSITGNQGVVNVYSQLDLKDHVIQNVGGMTLTGNIDMLGSSSILNLASPVNGSDATNKTYVDAGDSQLQSKIDTEKGRIDAILQGSDVNLDQFKEVVDFVNSIDLSNDESLMNAVINIENSISQETSDRESADLVLEDMISSLDQTLSSNISTLTNSLDTEISDRISAIESVEQEISDLSDSLDSSVTTINDSIDSVIASVAEEHAHHAAAEVLLQANIDVEKGRIDAILDGSTIDLDQFAEVVSFVQSIDLTNDDALLNAVISIEDSITDEAAERQAADSAIEDSISSLESNINSELSTLSDSFNTEVSDRISSIETVESSISDLTETLDTAILTINDSINDVISIIDAEETRATNAEGVLQSNIDTEKGRIDAILEGSDVNLDQFREVVAFVESIDLTNDEGLMNAVINIEDSISQEVTDRESADSVLENMISNLDQSFSGNISTLTNSLDGEIADRISSIEIVENEISDLTDSLDSSVMIINDSINGISDDLSAEVVRAEAAENQLQSNIDTEKGRIDAILQGSDINLDQFKEVVDFVNSIDLTNDEALMNAIINIEDSISQEVTDRESADLILEDTISSLDQTLTSDISTLTSSLDQEIADRISSIDSIETEIADLIVTLDSSVMTINDSINGITDDLNAEIDRATAAESSLQSEIDTEKARIDAILLGSDVDLDQFAEIVTFVQSIDLTNDDALLNAVISIEDSITDEATERQAADLAIEDTISSLESNINSELSTLTGALNTEIGNRISDIETVESAIADLTETVDTAIIEINDSIDAEVVRATAAEAALNAAKLNLAGGTMTGAIDMGGSNNINNVYDLSAEFINAKRLYSTHNGGTIILDSDLDAGEWKRVINLPAPINGSDATNKTYVDAADATLQSNIDTEKSRIDAILQGSDVDLDQFAEVVTFVQSIDLSNDDSLLNAVTSINDAIDAEVAARIADVDFEEARARAAEVKLTGEMFALDAALRAADTTLQSNIDTEIAARIADVDAEETRALAAEQALDARAIAAETALSSDLADLQSYVDTTVDSAIDTLTSDLSDETSARIADVDAEETRALAAEAALSATFSTALSTETFRATAAEIQLSNDLSDETSYRLDADTLLQSNIDVEKGRIDAILLASDADKDSFAEIVTLINSVDTTNDTAFASYVLSNNASLSSLSATFSAALSTEEAARIADVDAEEARALAAEATLSSDLAYETARATNQENILYAALTTEITRAYETEGVLQSNINAEVTRATTAEALLQTNINTEANERMAEDITIQGNIDIEASRAQAAETAIATDLGTEIAARISAVSSEETRAMLAEAALSATFSSAISTEATRAIATEGVLQSNIDVEKSRIDAILIGASASADNFAEIVSLINSVDTTNDQVFAGYVLSNDAALAAESARATATEASLSATFSTAISTEVSRAIAAELVLTNDLATEVSRAIAAEGVLTSALTAEEASRIAGDSALQSSLNNEIADRIAAGQSAQSALDSETARAIAAEGVLTSDLASEVSRAIAAEAALSATFSVALSSEVSRAIAAEAALSATFSAALSDEITRATFAELTLSNELSDETSYRIDADTLLQSNIDVEKGRIDAILIGASASADNFAEIVQLINSVDTTNDQVFAGYVLSNDAALASEISRAQSAESELSVDLSTETDARISVDAILHTEITTEVARAIAAETALSSTFSVALTSEISRAIAAETTLSSNLSSLSSDLSDSISAETFRATAAEIQLQNDLSDEVSNRIDADTLLQSNIDTEKFRIDAILIGASASADNFAEIVQLINSVDTTNDQVFAGYVLSNDAALAAEESSRIAGDVALSATFSAALSDQRDLMFANFNTTNSNLNNLSDGLVDEMAARFNADQSLDAARIAGDAALSATFSAAISAEVSRATAAESALAADFANIYCKKVAVNETPNGVLTTFTLASHVRIGSEMIYVNGLLMEVGEDYTTIVTSGKVSSVEFIFTPSNEMKLVAYGVYGV